VRNLSPKALESMFAANTDEVWLLLVTIQHPTLTTPLRFVNNLESVTSRGNLFVAFPFEIELPGQDPENIGEARIKLDNIDRSIVTTLRAMTEPPTVTFEIILASQPDVVEAAFEGLTLRNSTYDALSVSGILRFEDIVSEPVSVQMTPGRFPAMY
jgi:hypothetical protein